MVRIHVGQPSAGARLMASRPMGNSKPELVSAVLTRSRDSLTAASGKPNDDDNAHPHFGLFPAILWQFSATPALDDPLSHLTLNALRR